MALENTGRMVAQQPGQMLQARLGAYMAGNQRRNMVLGNVQMALQSLMDAYQRRRADQMAQQQFAAQMGLRGREVAAQEALVPGQVAKQGAEVEGMKARADATRGQESRAAAAHQGQMDAQQIQNEIQATLLKFMPEQQATQIAEALSRTAHMDAQTADIPDAAADRSRGLDIAQQRADTADKAAEAQGFMAGANLELDKQKLAFQKEMAQAQQAGDAAAQEQSISKARYEVSNKAQDDLRALSALLAGKPVDELTGQTFPIDIPDGVDKDTLKALRQGLLQIITELDDSPDPFQTYTNGMAQLQQMIGAPEPRSSKPKNPREAAKERARRRANG